MDNITIEELSLKDVDTIKELETNQQINILSKDTILTDLQSNQTKYLVLKLNENIIGYITFDMVLENMDIQSIVIDKNYQRQGYASYLLNYTFEYAKTNNISNIFLEVRMSNEKAINLYKKLGFKYINTRKKYYPDNFEDALIFLKNI